MLHSGTQSTFAAALLARHAPPNVLRLAGDAESLDRRFGVYRNNVFASLVAILTARYPAVVSLVGVEFFGGMAAEFAASHPPASPVMLEYGSGFAAFIASFGPAQDIPYLADVAILEWARHTSMHAPDAAPAPLEYLAKVNSSQLDAVRLILHPAARLFASDYPAVSVWRINAEGADASCELSGREAALIARPDLSVHVHNLTAGAHEFLKSIASGALLGEAVSAAQLAQADFDVAATLALVFSAGAIAAVTLP